MRDIIFRGKRLDNGEWIEGDYFRKYIYDRDDNVSLHHLIGWQVADNDGEMCNDYEDVDPTTVGQYTGLKDRYGDRIWEGDIVRRDDYDNYVVKYGYFNEHGENAAPSDSWGWYLDGCCDKAISTPHVIHSIDGIMALFPRYSIDNEQYSIPRLGFQIIGSIHDNPDLLK